MAMKQNNFYLRWQKAAGAAKSESRSQAEALGFTSECF